MSDGVRSVVEFGVTPYDDNSGFHYMVKAVDKTNRDAAPERRIEIKQGETVIWIDPDHWAALRTAIDRAHGIAFKDRG